MPTTREGLQIQRVTVSAGRQRDFWGRSSFWLLCELRGNGQQAWVLLQLELMREDSDWAAEGIGMTTRFGVAQEWTIRVLDKNASNNEPASPLVLMPKKARDGRLCSGVLPPQGCFSARLQGDDHEQRVMVLPTCSR